MQQFGKFVVWESLQPSEPSQNPYESTVSTCSASPQKVMKTFRKALDWDLAWHPKLTKWMFRNASKHVWKNTLDVLTNCLQKGAVIHSGIILNPHFGDMAENTIDNITVWHKFLHYPTSTRITVIWMPYCSRQRNWKVEGDRIWFFQTLLIEEHIVTTSPFHLLRLEQVVF